MKLATCFYKLNKYLIKSWELLIAIPYRKSLVHKCGKNVRIGRHTRAEGWNNIELGNHVSIGANCVFLTTRANVIIGDHVVFGPNVTCITGNHRIDMVGRYIDSVTDADKKPENDEDIIFMGDNWIGANSTILKGVTIGKGAVVAAGSVVTHTVDDYTIVAGVPARKIRDRFSKEELKQHIAIINKMENVE